MDIDRMISVRIQGLLVFESPLHHDERGYFLENWRKKDLVENGVPESFFHHKLQNNVSVSNQGVIRGMHCQGYEKLMTVASGTFKMIFIDLRIDSPTYKSVDVIDVKPGRVVFVPSGVANGAQSLVHNGILNYLVTDYYDPHKNYLGMTPLDKDANLSWDSLFKPIISEKDQAAKNFKEVLELIESSKKKVALIGSTGAVGKVLCDKLRKLSDIDLSCFNRNNVEEALKEVYDVVICTAPSSEKLLTNLGLKNDDSEIEGLLNVLKNIQTGHMILVSTKSVFDSGTRYSTIHQKIYNSVIEAHKDSNTIYIMDTLYGKTLKKGFINDLLSRQWTYISNDIVLDKPDLEKYYKKVNNQLWVLVEPLTDELLRALEPISDIYPDEMCYQVTAINDLARHLVANLNRIDGVKLGIDKSEIFTGRQIKGLLKTPDNSTLGQYFKKQKGDFNLENL
ncbi:dTDP-4-dehydrorhamnose 3,5-epimerase family protein [Streptococcus vestibularis]|uniref:Putative dTDP-4-dehydrorhamnose 3,5-epimerase n=1 Tax=Streptococcus vestibularis TaxID=1343 RepID=A0A564TXS6_STRVE|nr:dTDP-4-dehydrorhamnose 3,5-epimerase family protein [Streptococcus vestibularis]VUX12035.1 putative dTDP-4-dehydrorhamnose 3,5-epimerase [Streptococcus vestibularis]